MVLAETPANQWYKRFPSDINNETEHLKTVHQRDVSSIKHCYTDNLLHVVHHAVCKHVGIHALSRT